MFCTASLSDDADVRLRHVRRCGIGQSSSESTLPPEDASSASDGSGEQSEDALTGGLHCVGLWNQHLFKCDEFRRLVCDWLQELQPVIDNLYEENELGCSEIDTWLDVYREDINRNNEL